MDVFPNRNPLWPRPPAVELAKVQSCYGWYIPLHREGIALVVWTLLTLPLIIMTLRVMVASFSWLRSDVFTGFPIMFPKAKGNCMHKSAFGSILHVLQGLSAGKLFGCFAGILHLLQNWFLQHVSIGGRSLAWDHLAEVTWLGYLGWDHLAKIKTRKSHGRPPYCKLGLQQNSEPNLLKNDWYTHAICTFSISERTNKICTMHLMTLDTNKIQNPMFLQRWIPTRFLRSSIAELTNNKQTALCIWWLWTKTKIGSQCLYND